MYRSDAVGMILEAVVDCSSSSPKRLKYPHKSSNMLKFLNLNIASDKSQDDFVSYINKSVLDGYNTDLDLTWDDLHEFDTVNQFADKLCKWVTYKPKKNSEKMKKRLDLFDEDSIIVGKLSK